MRCTGHLEDIFTDTDSIKHKMVPNAYIAGMKGDTHCSDKQEDKALDKQIKKFSAGRSMTDDRQDHDISYQAPEAKSMKRSKKSKNGEIPTRPGHISHWLEMLGID